MKTICSEAIKQQSLLLGADLCAIASVDRFADAPPGFHPTDILEEAQSVIVLATRFPASALLSPSPALYTFAILQSAAQMDAITFKIATELDSLGCSALPIPARGPYDAWDAARQHGQGVLSLKHAAVQAGLGQLGKNTLLVNDQFGNLLTLGAIIIDKELTADHLASYQACIPSCRICLDACPAKALDGTTLEQRKCREENAKSSTGPGAVYSCNLCRKSCPQHQGLNKGVDD